MWVAARRLNCWSPVAVKAFMLATTAQLEVLRIPDNQKDKGAGCSNEVMDSALKDRVWIAVSCEMEKLSCRPQVLRESIE